MSESKVYQLSDGSAWFTGSWEKEPQSEEEGKAIWKSCGRAFVIMAYESIFKPLWELHCKGRSPTEADFFEMMKEFKIPRRKTLRLESSSGGTYLNSYLAFEDMSEETTKDESKFKVHLSIEVWLGRRMKYEDNGTPVRESELPAKELKDKIQAMFWIPISALKERPAGVDSDSLEKSKESKEGSTHGSLSGAPGSVATNPGGTSGQQGSNMQSNSLAGSGVTGPGTDIFNRRGPSEASGAGTNDLNGTAFSDASAKTAGTGA